jgi:hypothetical protein
MKKYLTYILESYKNYNNLDIPEQYIEDFYTSLGITNNDDFHIKYETYVETMDTNITLQFQLFKYNHKNVISLFNIINDANELTKSYEFQKEYIINILKSTENNISIISLLLKIKNKFGLNPIIIKEYDKYMSSIIASDYNI